MPTMQTIHAGRDNRGRDAMNTFGQMLFQMGMQQDQKKERDKERQAQQGQLDKENQMKAVRLLHSSRNQQEFDGFKGLIGKMGYDVGDMQYSGYTEPTEVEMMMYEQSVAQRDAAAAELGSYGQKFKHGYPATAQQWFNDDGSYNSDIEAQLREQNTGWWDSFVPDMGGYGDGISDQQKESFNKFQPLAERWQKSDQAVKGFEKRFSQSGPTMYEMAGDSSTPDQSAALAAGQEAQPVTKDAIIKELGTDPLNGDQRQWKEFLAGVKGKSLQEIVDTLKS